MRYAIPLRALVWRQAVVRVEADNDDEATAQAMAMVEGTHPTVLPTHIDWTDDLTEDPVQVQVETPMEVCSDCGDLGVTTACPHCQAGLCDGCGPDHRD